MDNNQDIILEYTKEAQVILGNKLKKIILYGSYARGDYRENSDIDIMILTTYKDDEIRKVKKSLYDIAFDFEMKYGVDISVILKNEEHFNYWVDALPFYSNIQKEGVILSE